MFKFIKDLMVNFDFMSMDNPPENEEETKAHIDHDEEKEGYPPLKIIGKKIILNEVSLPANLSSQYISSLMMLGIS